MVAAEDISLSQSPPRSADQPQMAQESWIPVSDSELCAYSVSPEWSREVFFPEPKPKKLWQRIDFSNDCPILDVTRRAEKAIVECVLEFE